MAAERGSPAREPTTAGRGRGRGGRGGRGRGRGGSRGGASNAGVTKNTAPRGGRGGTRRGRAKTFSDSRVQAAYERQRDLKATYQAVAQALKPALQELAERTIEDLLASPDAHKNSPHYDQVISDLQEKFDIRIREVENRRKCDAFLADATYEAEKYIINQMFQNAIEDLLDRFIEGQENRVRILDSLQKKSLPVDIRDDQYEFRAISDEHFDNEFGIHEDRRDGILVPYPGRVEGTARWQRGCDIAAAAAAAAASASASTPAGATSRGRSGRGRGGIRRRATGQLDGQGTPKRSTRSTEDSQLLLNEEAPAPAKGLLASAAEADILPEGTPDERDSTSGSPEPSSFANGVSDLQANLQGGKLHARDKSPPLPKTATEPDEYGCRSYRQRPSGRDKGTNARFIIPQAFQYGDLDIGFRDGFNDSTKGHTHAKRGKYLNQPNSDGFHFDHWCNGYDFDKTKADDFDQDLVRKHRLHPTYGVFLSQSVNEAEAASPCEMPGKPVVFIANPSGRISHASRSFQMTMNHNRSEEAPLRSKMSASLQRFCKINSIDKEDYAITEYLPTEEEMREKSLGTAILELESRPVVTETTSEEEQDTEETVDEAAEKELRPDLSALTDAAALIDAQEAPKPTPVVPKPAKYDAVRDLFVSEPSPVPASAPLPVSAPVALPPTRPSALDFLADLCESTPQNIQPSSPKMVERTMAPSLPPPQPHHDSRTHLFREPEVNYGHGEQAPISFERGVYPSISQTSAPSEQEVIYPPNSPTRDTRMEHVDSGRRLSFHQPIHHHHLYQPAPTPAHHYAPREEPVHYMAPSEPSPPRVDAPPYPQQVAHDPTAQQHHTVPPGPEYQSQHYYPSSHPMQDHGGYPSQPHQEHVNYPPHQEHHGYAQPPQDHGVYAPHQPGYPAPEPREIQPPQGHPYDHGYEPMRRMSVYSHEQPPSRPSYWSVPGSSAPPPTQHMPASHHSLPPPTHAHPTQHYLPAPGPSATPSQSRNPFTSHGSSEPLPPLRPPRARNQSIHEEPMIDPALRSTAVQPSYGNYYPSAQAPAPAPIPSPAPSRPYYHSYPPEPLPGFQQHRNNERMPTPKQHGYITSPPPPPGYGPPEISPTFGTMQMSSGLPPMVQDPSQQGMPPNSVFRHQSSASYSGQQQPLPSAQGAQNDNSKYRKLQPAPIPAHRTWPNKPELKTIPYDHKDSAGGSATLPNSGPTQIRGWNINQHRRRPRSDRRDNNSSNNNNNEASVNEREHSR